MGCKQDPPAHLTAWKEMPHRGLCSVCGHSPHHCLVTTPSPAQSLRLTRSHREPDHACSISTAPALPRPAPGDCLGSIWPGPLLPTPDPWLSSTLLLPAPPPLCTEVQTPGCGVSEGRGNIPAIGQDLGLQCFAVGRAAVGDSRGHQRGAESSRFSFPGS